MGCGSRPRGVTAPTRNPGSHLKARNLGLRWPDKFVVWSPSRPQTIAYFLVRVCVPEKKKRKKETKREKKKRKEKKGTIRGERVKKRKRKERIREFLKHHYATLVSLFRTVEEGRIDLPPKFLPASLLQLAPFIALSQ